MEIIGAHLLMYSSEADKVREVLRDVLDLDFVDTGGGWLIFALPPAEMGVHPAEPGDTHMEFSLMVKDIAAAKAALEAKGMTFQSEPHEEDWGIFCLMNLPGGGAIGFYQPKHELAIKA